MNRTIAYPGSLPKSADFLNAQRNAMISDGAILQAVFGTSPVASGFTCTALAVPGMGVQVSAGALTQFTSVDATAYGELPADLTEFCVKQGINLDSTILNMAAPTTVGQSIAYLIEATFAEADGTPVVLPYVNAANPSQPFAGPTNSGAAQNTTRNQTVTLAVKAGAAVATGTQTPPAADNGYVPLFVVTVAFGQTAITAANIAQHPSAPFPPYTLPQLSPGFSHQQAFAASGTFTVPAGVTRIKFRVWSGGGGGAGSAASTIAFAGTGGGAGGYAELVETVTPGQAIAVTVGQGGAGGVAQSPGASGGTSSVGTFVTVTGGAGGAYQAAFATTNTAGGQAVGGIVNFQGGFGGIVMMNGSTGNGLGGAGGNAPQGGQGGVQSSAAAGPGQFPGGGGGGAGGPGGLTGGAGANGLVIVEY
ncbi:MAG TPA: hypothetical protein VNC39_07720 [Acidocella sp.]|jgi:hypothetical protein|uniref:glycine-rich domain-containing protein n=1 Tax=Acidocella sp. TaxID=50710 RepID=UPI002C681293|nr:hypothetical protein [Acidocella sp.]HVE21847.1 hypothetical protein [Acidocella sp.]